MWKALGDKGLSERVDRCVALADYAVVALPAALEAAPRNAAMEEGATEGPSRRLTGIPPPPTSATPSTLAALDYLADVLEASGEDASRFVLEASRRRAEAANRVDPMFK